MRIPKLSFSVPPPLFCNTPSRDYCLNSASPAKRPSGRAPCEASAVRPSRGGALRALGVAVLVATVLLTGLLALAGVLLWPTPAEAQSQTQLWSVSFTASTTGPTTVGCDSGVTAVATAVVCPSDTLTYGGVTNSFTSIKLWPSGRLDFVSNTSGTGFPSSLANALLTLDVNGTSFSFEDVDVRVSGYNLRWTNTGLTWNLNDMITLTITQETPTGPSVDSIAFNSAGTDGAFKTDDAVTATVTFSESVTVDTTDGTPQLTIKMGGSDKVLEYSSGSPGAALVFSGYTVAANDEDNDGLSIEADKLDANSGTIKSTADATVDAVLTHAAVAASANHKVDGVKPTLVTTGDLAPKTSLDGSKIILNFSEPIGSADATKFTVKVGTTTQTISGGSRSGPEVELTLTTALAAAATNITVALDAEAVTDVPGNGIAAVSATSVTRTLPPGKPALTLAAKDQSIDATVVFTAHGTSDITKYQYRTKTTGSYGSWTDSTDDVSNTGGTFTIGSLTNGTEYTVQARGVNSDGEGAESDAAMATPDAPPAVDSLAITSTPANANTYIIGEDIVVTFTFDKNITISGSGGEPYSTMTIGVDTEAEAECAVGTAPTVELVCTHTVTEGEEDSGGIVIQSGLQSPRKYIVGPLGQRANTDHSGLAADSDHKVDGIRPTLSRADADPNDLTKIILTFSEAIGTIGSTGITVKKGGADQSIDSVAIDSTDATKVVVTLDTALLSTDTDITVDLAADAVTDVPGNGIAEVLGTSVSVEDTMAPTFVSAGTNGTDEVVLTYDEALNTTAPATSAFTVKVGGTGRGVDTVAISGSDVMLTLASAFRPGDTLTVSYTKPGSNPIKDAADNEADSLAETTVTNNLAATAPDAPGNLSAGIVAISAAPFRAAADILELSWVIGWHNGSSIEKHQYRYAVGSSVPATTGWTDIIDSAPGGVNDIGLEVGGLEAGTQYTFEVRAVNGIGNGDEASVMETTRAVNWSFTLRDSSNNDVTELTEGGDSATATVSITNNVRFGADQTVRLRWGILDLSQALIRGAGDATTITISAEQASGSLEISSPQNSVDSYDPPSTQPLAAIHSDTAIGSIQLTRVDDESVPVAFITVAPLSVDEGESIEVEINLNPPFGDVPLADRFVNFTVTDSDNALSGTLPTTEPFNRNQESRTITLTAAENTTQNDGAHDVTFTLELNDDAPYTLGTPPAVTSVTITVRDDDTPPLAPENLRAQAGNTEATLTWQAPAASTPDHGQPVLHYEYRVKTTGSFGSWTRFPNSDADTRSHKFTGLTNGQEHTYQVRAVNVAGGGAFLEKSVTPIVGIAVSFGAATLSVDEGDQATVTVTLATAPAVGETVTVPIVATQGTGLDSTEYSGVPANVVFNASETSKSFTVTAVQDTDDEPDRLLTFSLGTLPEGYVPGTNSQLVLTLVDDDHPIVSATFRRSAAEVQEGTSRTVAVRLSQAPEREVVLPIDAARGAGLEADEVSGVPASVTIAADATEAVFTVTFADDTVEEGNETLTLTFGTFADSRVTQGANTRLVLTVTDDDGPPLAPDVSVQTGDGYAALSWAAVVNDSPVLRYEVRWRESDGGTFNAWLSVGLVTSYRVEGLTNDRAYEFEVRGVNAHGDGEEVSAPGTPTERLTGIPKAPQWLRFADVTDSSRAELKWGRPSNGTDRTTRNSASAPFSQIQGYRIEVCRTTCGDEANWYAVVPNTRAFVHKYTHQVLAPGVIRENRYRVQAININGKTGPWSNVATLDPTRLERFWLVSPNSSTVDVHLEVWNPDGNPLYVRYTGGGEVRYKQQRLTKKGFPVIGLPVEASTHYRVEVDFVDTFDSPRLQSATVWSLQEGADPYTSPYAKDLLDAEVWRGGVWQEAPDNELYLRMGETGKYRVRLKPCGSIYSVIPRRIQAPAGRLRASPTDFEPTLFSNLNCKVVQDGWRTDEAGNFVTLGDIYDMSPPHLQARADDRIPIYAGAPNVWREVTVTARALEDYARDVRADALLSAPFAVVYNHEVYYGSDDTRSGLVSEGTGLVRVSVDRPADAVLPVPGGVTIGSATRVMSWDAVSGASHYLVEWRYGPRYSNRANTDRSHRTATSVTLPLGGSGRGPITARVRAYSASAVSAWSAELTWDSRAPTLNVLDTAVNEDDGSVGFLVTLDPAASGTVTVDYATQDGTAVAPADYTATSGTLTFAPGEREKKTDLVPITDDDEADSGETFRLMLSNPTGSDANNGAAVLGDAEAVATILNSEREAASLSGFTLVDAGTNGDLMALADGVTVPLGELLASSYGIRAEMSPGAAPGSVRLELSGAKTAAVTDDAAPWSLYGDGAGRVNGASLPAGSYTLKATAYANSGGQGDERGSLEVSFTVAAGALGVTTPGPFTVAEGETAVTTLAASDTGTGGTASWSIPEGTAGGADGAAFALTPKGVLSLVEAKDFEAPDDADGDGTYQVTVAMREGAQSATAALVVTLSDVNEAPVAKASSAPERVREGVEVMLDGSASTDPDVDDTLSYAWTQADDGAPRVVLSDAGAAQPVFTSPSDLAAETGLGFTLRVTDAEGLHSEDTVTVTVTLISEVSIAAGSDYAPEGTEAVFRLTRAGSALAALVVPVSVEETGAMLGSPVPENATFAAGERETELRVPTAADALSENDSRVTVSLGSGSGWQLAPGATSASLTVLDDDATAVVAVSTADVTIWSADMTVMEYGPRSIGAGSADQFSNQMGRAGLRAKWLWYDPPARKLKLGFDDSLDDAESLTLHMGDVSLGFPENTGGNSSFSLENVDISWSDGETVAVRVSKPSTEAVSTDATLASLTVEGASLSPAFDAGALLYRAVVDAGVGTVTVSATATDGGAAVAYGPAEDGDAALADHQVAVPDEGETLVEVTVTAADGTVRRYRMVVARAADAVVDRSPVAATLSVGDGAAEAGWFRLRIAFADAVTGLALADVTAARVGGDGAAVSDLAETETGRVWTAWVAAADAGRYTVRLAPDAASSGERLSLAAVLAVDVDAAGNATAVAGPVVTSIALAMAPDGGLTAGNMVRMTFAFSEAVTVVTDGGTPSVGITLDGTARRAAYAGGTGTASLAFAYTLTADDGTVSSVSVTADSLALNGGTIRDAGGRDADLAHPGVGETAEDAETESASALTSLVLVDTGTGAETALADGDALVLEDPSNGSWGLAASVASDAGVGSVLLELTGAKTVTVTDNAAPYSLYGDENGTVSGAGLPAGSYTLGATAYAEAEGGGAELGTLEVSFTVAASEPVDPDALTASFEGVPASHGGPGSEAFTFRVRFSPEPRVSYKVLRDESFAVTGGDVDKARRVDGRNDLREIHIEPKGWGDVTVTLPGGRACGTTGAICTADGKVLANTEVATVPGPLALSVADAQVREGPNALLAFEVTLNRAASETVTVDYATSDGTATAGADYTATSDTLTFQAGETQKTVNVAVLDDVHDDDGETLTLTLSNAVGARIRDAEALGTIENSDPLPKAWLARFGRTVANHVVEAVRGRMSSAQGPSRRVTLGGAELKEPPATEITQASPWDELTPEDQRPESFSSLRVREFLLSSSFEVPLAENATQNPGPGWTAWGGAARTSFSGRDSEVSIDGDVTTATLGVDRAWDRLITGVALARSTGDGSYGRGEIRGDLKSSITSAHPYLRFSINDRLSAWTLLGYGKGELTLTHGGGEERTDIEMKMAALGARGALVAAGGFDISARTDALLVRTSSEKTSRMAETEADVSRLRLVLEGSRPLEFASGSSLIPSVELGVRRDGGDAERGVGFEVGGAVRYVNPSIGLTVEITARRLMAHQQSGYSEWGAGGSVQFAPGGSDRGFSAKLGSSVGTAASGVEGLWAMGDARGLAGGAQAPGRVDAEAGYAMGAFGGSGVITPYGGFSMSGDRKYRAGWRLRLGDSFNLSLEGDRTENPDAPSRHGVALRGSLRW